MSGTQVQEPIYILEEIPTHQEWHKKVYKKPMKNTKPENWESIRRAVIYRDHFTCLRCDKRMRGYKSLTVHHLIPREEGGSNDMTNLVSLCSPCHDIVEINGLRTVADIAGSYEDPLITQTPIMFENATETVRPDWHSWVYGGAKNPNL